MKILDLALKDLSQMFRDRRNLLFLVALPIIFTFFMGLAYGGGGAAAEQDDRIRLAIVDPEPDGELNRMLAESLARSAVLVSVPLDETEAMSAFHDGDVAGVLIIPAGFSAGAAAGLTPQLRLIADTASAPGQSLYQALRATISQLMSAVESARLSVRELDDPAEYGPALEFAWSRWAANPASDLVRIEQAAAAPEPETDWTGGNPYNQASPGILVQFAIFGLITSAQILVNERKTRTLQRLMTTAMQPWQIVAGHLLAMFSLTFIQTAMLVVFGQLVLGVDYLREPLGTLLVSVSLGLWVSAMGLLIGVLAKEDQQVVLYSMLAMFLFSALGGTWFPLEMAGGAFAALGRWMPSTWAMTGLQNILIRGLDLSSAWLPAGILAVYAAGFFLLAVWRFRKMEI